LLLGAWAEAQNIWTAANRFLAEGDAMRYWLNRTTAVLIWAFFVTWFVIILNLLLKRVAVTEEGMEFSGLFRRSIRWHEIGEARINRERYTWSLVVVSRTGKRYVVGIGDENAAHVCRAIVAKVSKEGTSSANFRDR
jgi:hypothetical protein